MESLVGKRQRIQSLIETSNNGFVDFRVGSSRIFWVSLKDDRHDLAQTGFAFDPFILFVGKLCLGSI